MTISDLTLSEAVSKVNKSPDPMRHMFVPSMYSNHEVAMEQQKCNPASTCCAGLSVRGCTAMAVLLGGGYSWTESIVMALVWLSGVGH